jgi:hypothetical protein
MDEFDGKETIVSHSGTRHLVADGTAGQQSHAAGRIGTQCGMGLKVDDPLGPFAVKQDCPFCLAQLRYAPTIRQMLREGASAQKAFLPVKEAAAACQTTATEICNAVAGAPDLYWSKNEVDSIGSMGDSAPARFPRTNR